MVKETDDPEGRTPSTPSSTERALLRKMADNYYGLHLLQVIQGIVHNLNGPLQIIYIRTEQLQQGVQKLIGEAQIQQSPEVQSLLSGMDAKVRSTLGSLDDLNAQLRYLNSDLVAEGYSAVGDVDINNVIEECLFLMNANMFFKHSVNKTVELADSIPLLKGRKTDFAIIVLSLLQNAAEALVDTEDKNVSIETSSQEGAVIIRVQDSGQGISEEDRQRILDVFYSTKNRSENEGELPQHAGLGLSLVSLVLEEYQGSIACESVPGETTFTVQIPFNPGPSD